MEKYQSEYLKSFGHLKNYFVRLIKLFLALDQIL